MKQYRLLKDYPHVKAGAILLHLAEDVYGIDGKVAHEEAFLKKHLPR